MPAEYAKRGWNTLLPIDQYTQSTPDDVTWEGTISGEKKPVFPHELSARPVMLILVNYNFSLGKYHDQGYGDCCYKR